MKKIYSIYKSKYLPVMLFLAYFIIPFIIYYCYFRKNMVPITGDGIQYFTSKLFFNNALKDGELPLWNPYLANGIPYASDFNGAFYPLGILLSPLPIKWFVYCYYSIHLAIGATFFFSYLNEIKCSRFASLCTSIIYLFSIHLAGYRKSHMVIIVAIVYLPVILYFIEKYMNTREIKYLLGSSFFIAIQLVSGSHVQYCVYTDILVFFYLIYRMVTDKFPIRKMVKDILIWGFIYIGLSAIQLIPTIELLLYYIYAGAGQTSYDAFLSYSIHPVKILMMIFPNMFGTNVYEALGAAYSSEYDIEIFLGVGVFLLILYIIRNNFNDNRVKMSAIFMGCSFIYASNAHIPVLNKIIYHIPILGGFRCSSRVLFIYIFFGYVLSAIALTEMQKEKELYKFNKMSTKILFIIGTVLAIAFPFIYKSSYKTIKLVFINSIVIIIGIVIATKVLLFIHKRKRVNIKILYSITCALFVSLALIETFPYSKVTVPTSVNDFQVNSPITKDIKDNIGNNKVWLANDTLDGSYQSIIEYNSNVSMEIPSINAYIAFNNPRLFKLFTKKSIMEPYYNYSGLLSGFPDASNNITLQNNLLSMLGVKYIIDPNNFISDDGFIISNMIEDKIVYKSDYIQIPNKSSDLFVYSKPISIKPNTYYIVSFEAKTNTSQTSFYADFYGGEQYDNNKQNTFFKLQPGKHKYEALIYSDNSNISTNTQFRFVVNPTSKIEINNTYVKEMNASRQENVYKPFIINKDNRIFINTNAKNILFSPNSVKNISNTDNIYDNTLKYDLANTSYIENNEDEENYITGKTSISDIKWKRNFITAKVNCDKRSFVNFSQNYFPGWKAYIDGKRTHLFMVNGLIQGIEVPDGEHNIKFVYRPFSIVFGLFITILSLLLMIYLIKKCPKKNTKYNNEAIRRII